MKPSPLATCDVCGESRRLVWRVRNRNWQGYQSCVCEPCGFSVARIDGMFVEEMPFMGVEEKWPVTNH